MFQKVKQYVINLLDLFYPNACLFCAEKLVRGEHFLCINCFNDLPVIVSNDGICPSVSNQLKGKVPFHYTYSLYFYNKAGKTGKLLKDLKYRGNRELGLYLGRVFGEKIKKHSGYEKIDFIVPVPLHPRRLLKRGYNQADLISKGMSEILCIPEYNGIFERVKYNISQTKKGRASRFASTSGLFQLIKRDYIECKHILLVDDVITTGATIESLINTTIGIRNVKISVAALCSPYE